MDIKPLPIKLIRQDPKSDDCLRCCALMVFKYFDDPIAQEELWKKLHAYKKHSGLCGGYPQDLGRLALKKKYQFTIFHYDFHWWDKQTAEQSKKTRPAFVKSLKALKKKKTEWRDKKLVDKEIKFVEEGGKYKFQIPKLTAIDYYLQKQIPVFLSVCAQDLYKNPQENYHHIILVVGKAGNEYLIKDPYLSIESILDEDLLNAWVRNGGWMFIIHEPFIKRDQLPLFK